MLYSLGPKELWTGAFTFSIQHGPKLICMNTNWSYFFFIESLKFKFKRIINPIKGKLSKYLSLARALSLTNAGTDSMGYENSQSFCQIIFRIMDNGYFQLYWRFISAGSLGELFITHQVPADPSKTKIQRCNKTAGRSCNTTTCV